MAAGISLLLHASLAADPRFGSVSLAAPAPAPLTSADAFAGEKPEYRRQSLCRGAFRFYHYSVDGFRDHGWGCGLRTTQLMLSWLSSSPPPPIPRMQAILQRANPAAFTGERGWIGVNDAVVLLDELHGAPVRLALLPRDRALHIRVHPLACFLTAPLHVAAGARPLAALGRRAL